MSLKRLLISLSLILICYLGNAQFINKQTVGSPTTNYNSKGALSSDSGFIVTNNGDTAIGRQINYYDGTGGKGYGFVGLNGNLYYRYNGMWMKLQTNASATDSTIFATIWNARRIADSAAAAIVVPAQFNPIAGYATLITGTYPNKTFSSDSTFNASRARVQKPIDSLGIVKANDNAVVHLAGSETITGTKSFNGGTFFLNNGTSGNGTLLLTRSTAYSSAILQNKGYTIADSADVTNGLALKVNYTDTASMLSPYYRTSTANAALALKVNYTDTAAMLAPYARSVSGGYLPLSGGTLTGNLNGTTANFTGFVAANGFQSAVTGVAGGSTTNMTSSSSQNWYITSGAPTTTTIVLPNATTIAIGNTYQFNNNATGGLAIQQYGGGALYTVPSGGYVEVILLSNSFSAGQWDVHVFFPSNSTAGTAGFSTTGTINSSGLDTYTSNLGSSYTSRTKVDKNYVDSSRGVDVKYSDTASMLNNYRTGIIALNADTATIQPRFNNVLGVTALKVNYTDTASMLSGYQKKLTLTTTGTSGASTLDAYGNINIPQYATSLTGYVQFSDTTYKISSKALPYKINDSMKLVNAATYVPLTRTLTINGTALDLSANRSWSVGTVTSVVTGTGLTGGTITSTGTIAVDTGRNNLKIPTGNDLNQVKDSLLAVATHGTVTSVAALTLGTTGTDLSSTVANGTTTPVITLNVPTASASNRGALSSADWTTFNNKQSALSLGTVTETTSSILTLSGWTNATVGSPTITVKQAATSQSGYLSSTDWNTFNNKQSSLTFSTGLTNTSGTITLTPTVSTNSASGGGALSYTGGVFTFTPASIPTSLPTPNSLSIAAELHSGGATTFNGGSAISIGIQALSITNGMLANSTISGISLGSNLAALTISTGLSGTSYNGSGAVTIALNAATSSVLGGVKPDGTSILNTAGAISVTKSSIGLGNVENTALSTWAGSGNITTVGTLSSGSIPYSLLTGTPSLSGYVPYSGATGTVNLNGQILTNVGALYGTSASFSNNGTTPTMYLHQTGTSGYPAMLFTGNNGTDIGGFTTYGGNIYFGGYNGTGGINNSLLINTSTGAATFVSSVGATSFYNYNVGYNTNIISIFSSGTNALPATSGSTQNATALRLRGGNNAVMDFGLNGTFGWQQMTDQAGLNSTYNLGLQPNGGNVNIGYTSDQGYKLAVNGAVSMSSTLSVTSTVTASAFYESSDSTLKNIIQRFSTPQGFDFVIGSWKTDKTNAQHFWNIAQEVERVYPQMVSTNEQGLKSINYIELHNKEIYDLQMQVEQLKKQINEISNRITVSK